ncbi:MAG: hypothetical protein ACTSRZ_01600 [Promethearchaeota archaeon]
MAEFDINGFIGTLVAIIGIIVSVLIENRFRKEDAKDYERKLALEQEKIKKYQEQLDLLKIPTPILSIRQINTYIFNNKTYMHINLEINNTGKENLAIENAVLIIDKPTIKPSGAIEFADILKPAYCDYIMKLKHDIPYQAFKHAYEGNYDIVPDKIKNFLNPDFLQTSKYYCMDVLQEYLVETGHHIATNEHLTTDKIKVISEPGFYRITLLIKPMHPKLTSFYNVSKIVLIKEITTSS